MKTIGQYQFNRIIKQDNEKQLWDCCSITTGENFQCDFYDFENTNYSRDAPIFRHLKNKVLFMSKVRHPFIMKLVDIQVHPKTIFLFFEDFKGTTLNDLVIQENGFSEEKTKKYFRQIMLAIYYIHSFGFSHCSLTLDNILVDSVATTNRLKLVGLDYCQINTSPLFENNAANDSMNIAYAAPEIIQQRNFDSKKSDIWCAGIILYSMIANHFPWHVESASNQADEKYVFDTTTAIMNGDLEPLQNISEDLQRLLNAILTADPDARPSAQQILENAWLKDDTSMKSVVLDPQDIKLEGLAKELVEKLPAMS